MEFVMSTDLNTALPKEIGFNFEELKAELSERLEYYNGLVVTETTIKEGKAERAKLSKLREAVEAKRKEVVEAKQETAAIEKLKEKKVRDYQKALEKSEEAFIEEFVSTSRVRAAAN